LVRLDVQVEHVRHRSISPAGIEAAEIDDISQIQDMAVFLP
jgi:hypothetical protein